MVAEWPYLMLYFLPNIELCKYLCWRGLLCVIVFAVKRFEKGAIYIYTASWFAWWESFDLHTYLHPGDMQSRKCTFNNASHNYQSVLIFGLLDSKVHGSLHKSRNWRHLNEFLSCNSCKYGSIPTNSDSQCQSHDFNSNSSANCSANYISSWVVPQGFITRERPPRRQWLADAVPNNNSECKTTNNPPKKLLGDICDLGASCKVEPHLQKKILNHEK